ncbi:MAG: DUF805 domain-containing protein [Oscillospiraceae bacterium]|jgi:uncharacterized membrane protein YhaH (DUF805 family)|nr:DUF805 domain-containing protein [Oscillospiraceae bacterium]
MPNTAIKPESKNVFHWFLKAFKNPHFKGRAQRYEFWSYAIIYAIVGSIASSVTMSNALIGSIISILSLVLLPSMICVTVRRLHDTGKSGFVFLFQILITALICVLTIVFVFQLISEVKDKDPTLYDYFQNALSASEVADIDTTELSDKVTKYMENNADGAASRVIAISTVGSLFSFAYGIFLFVCYVTKSKPGGNKYGPNPLGDYGNDDNNYQNDINNQNDNNGGGGVSI